MRLIDADAYCVEMRDFQNRISNWLSEAETDEAKHRAESAFVTLVEAKLRLDKQPTVDAVEVVRCEDCKWGKETDGSIECFVDLNVPTEYHGYKWFCPNGEKRQRDEQIY